MTVSIMVLLGDLVSVSGRNNLKDMCWGGGVECCLTSVVAVWGVRVGG